MDRDTSSLRAIAAAAGVATLLFGAWHSWKVFQDHRTMGSRTERAALAARWSDSLGLESDSLCDRSHTDDLVRPDPIGWLPEGLGLPLRTRGRADRWDFGCLQLPDSGMVLFVAVDSGCGRYSGNGLWSHSCGVVHQVWDLATDQGSSRVATSHSRSRWVHPGSSRICASKSPSEAPSESTISALCRGPRTRE